jgi:Na+/H+ antiporter NhaD/arsenite permease-like protein
MIPALRLLEMRGAELGIDKPYQFFWASGGLSSFLDNAPTYLSFVSLGKSVTAKILMTDPTVPVVAMTDGLFVTVPILLAISMGAVFMGANTYIGNGPNFMIKSISHEYGIKMPSFFGYMLWSILILVPIFILNTLIFF